MHKISKRGVKLMNGNFGALLPLLLMLFIIGAIGNGNNHQCCNDGLFGSSNNNGCNCC